jgi:hypothetical protein
LSQGIQTICQWCSRPVGRDQVLLRPFNHKCMGGNVNKEFQVHILNEDGKIRATAIAGAFDRCLEELKLACPEGREFPLVKTKLEEACFFAKKAMANTLGNRFTE